MAYRNVLRFGALLLLTLLAACNSPYTKLNKKSDSALTDSQAVAADAAALTASSLTSVGTDTIATAVTTDFTVPTTGSNGTAITWTASPTGVVSIDSATGRVTVTRQSSDTTITLTATVAKGSASATQTVTVTVSQQDADDQTAATYDADELTVRSPVFTSPDTSTSVTSGFTLPTTGSDGTDITWTSSDTSVSISGGTATVTRPASDTDVTLTATVTRNGKTHTATITITVKALSDSDAVTADANAITATTPTFTGSDTASSVTSNFTLPTSGSRGTAITWTASPSGTVSISGGTATVTRPAVGESDVTVTLTATVIKGSASETKTITITVKAATSLTFGPSSGWVQVGIGGDSDVFASIVGDYASLKFDSHDTPYVAYRGFNADAGARVKKFDGSGWKPVDGQVSSGDVAFTSLAIDADDNLYVAYEDTSTSGAGRITVREHVGTSWVTVGDSANPYLSTDQAIYISLAIDPTTQDPVVAYKDVANDNKVTVMKYNGILWQQVGSGPFSAGEVFNTSLAIDSHGVAYVAYGDNNSGQAATVMKHTGGGTLGWEPVGSAGFTPSAAYLTCMVLDSHGNPWVAYKDNSSGLRASVMKFDGNSWTQVGHAGLSDGDANEISLALSAADVPYIAYRDGSAGGANRTTVMTYTGTAWTTVGVKAQVSYSSSTYNSLAIRSDGTPYLAYENGGSTGIVTKAQ